MADFEPKRIELSTINGGQRFENGQTPTPNAFNDPIEASAYAQQLAEQVTDLAKNQPIYNGDNGGSPSVSIEETSEGRKFAFANLKGAKGEKGEKGKDGADLYLGETSTTAFAGDRGVALENDVNTIKSLLIQDKIVARQVDTASYTERITANGAKIVNDSDAIVLRINGRTVQNLCPVVSPSQIEFAQVELVTVSNGEDHISKGTYLQAEVTERGIEVKLKDNAVIQGHTVSSVKLVESVSLSSSIDDIPLLANKSYYFYCNNLLGTCTLNANAESYDINSTITGVSILPNASVTIHIPSDTTLPITQDNPVWVIQPMLVEGERNIGYAPMGGIGGLNSKIKSIKSEGSNLVDTNAMLNDNLVYEGNGVYKLTVLGEEGNFTRSSAYMYFDKPLKAGKYTLYGKILDFTVKTASIIWLSGAGFSGDVSLFSDNTYAREVVITNDCNKVRIYIQSNVSNSFGTYVRFRDLRLVKGWSGNSKNIPPYVPYGVSDTLVVDNTGVELRQWDYIDFANNRVVRCTSDVMVLTGNEDWRKTNYGFVITVDRQGYFDTHNAISNYYLTGYVNKGVHIDKTTMYIVDKDFETVEEFKAHLSNLHNNETPVTVFYRFETPYYEALDVAKTKYKAWANGTESVDTDGEIAPTIVTDYLTII